MSNSSSANTSSNLFMKRRRAYVACTNCRKRKVKCITLSEVDYRPCTRCAQKGLKCEYFTVPEDDPYRADTPPPQIQPPPRERDREGGWAPQPITPPSAGINDYLPSSSRGGRPNPVPPAGGAPRYPYRPRPATPAQPGSSSTPSWAQRSGPPQSQTAYPQGQFSQMQQHPGAAAPQYYHGSTPYVQPNAGYNSNSGAFYDPNYVQGYVQQQQQPGMVSPWPQTIQCVCPPGPCYCGARLNS
ncbi:hypothetical protein C8R47DRAFT_1090882 [Mycena vitilis]|nr:hypothetical protein C8R47DRAFT_1090882 [Mycena vitilis]